MVKFKRTGAEANSIAIRLARAYSNKNEIKYVDITDGTTGIYQHL